MRQLLNSLIVSVVLAVTTTIPVKAQDINSLPKYGSAQKTTAQQDADKRFISEIDKHYQGDRKKGAAEAAKRGWSLLRQGKPDEAMRRFNQAWLLDAGNGAAIWGMAAAQASLEKNSDALRLFAEADRLVGNDIDFAVDHARALGMIGVQTENKALVADALTRFAKLQARAPDHVLNFQNWAITLYHLGNYREAWQKVKLAEKTPRANELDKGFVAELQRKMPRP
ncbi:MAG: tetratricopeptide repeat protein [Rhodoferax sp.]|uniref:tetratricopeptide repeat protein n=1 Tax=Rhodoferax sp. TaxID=50421 RepID=UPI0027273115|nr:tetratricopeptide repeat protein [Rhodoferax sp.]MDO8448631.1 tetratricopeptide repeat protein [Rhodoferax sp.]